MGDRVVVVRSARLGAHACRMRAGRRGAASIPRAARPLPPSRSNHRGVEAPIAPGAQSPEKAHLPGLLAGRAARSPGGIHGAARARQRPHTLRSGPSREQQPLGASHLPAVPRRRRPAVPPTSREWRSLAHLARRRARSAGYARGRRCRGRMGRGLRMARRLGTSRPVGRLHDPQLFRAPRCRRRVAARTVAPDRSRSTGPARPGRGAHRCNQSRPTATRPPFAWGASDLALRGAPSRTASQERHGHRPPGRGTRLRPGAPCEARHQGRRHTGGQWRSPAMRDELHRLEDMGHMAELLEDVADLLAVQR